MANMHVLAQSAGKYRIALHIAVPTGNNSAGLPWRTVVRTSGLGGRTVLVDGDGTGGSIAAAEKTNIITDGSVYEEVIDWDVTRNGALTGGAILTYMDELYALRAAEVLALLQVQLAQYGRTR